MDSSRIGPAPQPHAAGAATRSDRARIVALAEAIDALSFWRARVDALVAEITQDSEDASSPTQTVAHGPHQ